MTRPSARVQSIARVRDELTVVSRRGTARTRQAFESLSVIDRALLNYVHAHPECRAVDIARYLQLNKSTVSRQLSALIDQGYLEARAGDGDQRGRGLVLTERGRSERERVDDEVMAAIVARLANWTDGEVADFAVALARFNDDAELS
jgi:DNA-binding MarR family transcriptional regulator